MKLSDKIMNMKSSAIRKLDPYSDEAIAKGKTVLNLNIGQPDIETPDIFFESLKSFDHKVLKYSESRGENILINSLINYYEDINISLKKENMIITNGGSEALTFAFLAICNPGDEVLAPEPFYTNYNSFADISGAKIKPFKTKRENGFRLPTRQEIESHINPKTKGILFSNPSNPTGTVYSKEEIQMLRDIALEHNLYIISDEVYREFVYDNREYYSPMYEKSIEDRVILIDSISKRYSSCGARVGLFASKNVELVDAVMKLAQSRLAAPTIEQYAAAMLYNTPQTYFDEVLRKYEKRRDVLYNELNAIDGVELTKPEGAFYVIAKLPVDSAEDFSKWILKDFDLGGTTVKIAPAKGFYSTKGKGENEVRLSYCINKKDLVLAAKILKNALIEYNSIFEIETKKAAALG
ncbi:MAG: pyridoxal phosphate-dependent aminotransferase [Clostridium sp.]|nr:pyridoxal phosphate-dependent aminotransferase [Clostridium sp.]